MRLGFALLCWALGLALGFSAQAQDPASGGRFSLVPTEGGALRLDTQTGEVSLCAEVGGALACRPVPTQRSGSAGPPPGESDRIAALEARIAALEARSGPAPGVGDAESVDRVADLAEQIMRRFFGVVRELRREMDGDQL